MSSSSDTTRERILQAAAAIIREKGVASFTLEAVTLKAGVSKGGLLYHFPSKDALLTGLVASGCDDFNQSIIARQNAGVSWLEAYLDAALSPGEFDELGPALQGALAENPALLAPARQEFRNWYTRAQSEGGLGAVLALLVLDGLFLHQQLGIDAGLDIGAIAGALPELWEKAT